MIHKLITISCVVFVIALILYITVVHKEEFKNFILKVDKKITVRNERIEENRKNKEQKLIEKADTKLLTYDENSKENNASKKSSKANNNSKENKKQDNAKDAKLKPSKAVEKIRPVLLPANKEEEEQNLKMLEMQKNPESSQEKPMNFKYGSKTTMQTKSSSQQKPIKVNSSDNDDFISFNVNPKGDYNPLNRDTKKQFDDIKNFLDLPENQDVLKNKGVSYNGKEFKTVNKIDPSVFKEQDDYYSNYANYKKAPSIYDSYRKQNNLINSANNKTINENNLHSFNDVKRFIDNNGNEVMQAQTKYAKPNMYEIANQYNEPLTAEQEDIDLNKLPDNFKKMIIQNILDRKNYDD